jgi:4-aminobutyrate--pyruvate transaminase
VQARAQEHGVIVRGIRDAIAICPPLIITEDQIDELFDGIGQALDDGYRHVQEKGLLAA